jgi:hypothetical protein
MVVAQANSQMQSVGMAVLQGTMQGLSSGIQLDSAMDSIRYAREALAEAGKQTQRMTEAASIVSSTQASSLREAQIGVAAARFDYGQALGDVAGFFNFFRP